MEKLTGVLQLASALLIVLVWVPELWDLEGFVCRISRRYLLCSLYVVSQSVYNSLPVHLVWIR